MSFALALAVPYRVTGTEAKRLRVATPRDLADEAFALKERLEALKGEMIRRELRHAEGETGRVTLSPPGEQDRTERAMLLAVLGITEAEFISRYTRRVKVDWRLTVTAKRQFRQAA